MNSSLKKKRRVDEGGGHLLPSVGDEDRLMQTLNELLDSNRTQMAMMSSMQDEMKGLKGEIIRLTEKCNDMNKSIIQTNDYCNQMKKSNQIMQVTQSNISDNMNSRFDDMDNKQKYHEVLLKNQQWKYSAPRPSEEYWDSVDEDEDAAAEEFLKDIYQTTYRRNEIWHFGWRHYHWCHHWCRTSIQ